MKSTSIPNRGLAFFLRRLVPSALQFKTITATDFLSCFFAGVLSQGTLFGALKPFGVAFYAAFPGNVLLRAMMLASIFAGSLISGEPILALKQTAMIFLYEWLKKLVLKNKQEPDLIRNAVITGAAAAVTGLLIFALSNQSIQSLLLLLMEIALICIVTSLFSITLQGQDPALKEKYTGQKNMEYFGLLVMGGAFLLGVSGIRVPGVSLDRIMAGVGLLMLTRHFGPGFGACAGTIAGLSLAAANLENLPSLIGVYAISGMISGMMQKSKLASGISFLMIQFLFFVTAKEVYLTLPDMIIPVVLFLIIPDLRAGNVYLLRRFIAMDTSGTPVMDKVRKTISDRLDSMSVALCRLGHTVDKQLKNHFETRGEIAGAVMEQLTQQVCSFCAKSSTCWETKLFFTFKTFNVLIDSLQKHQADPNHEVEQELNRFCVKSGSVIDALLRIIELKRVDKVWQKAVAQAQSAIPGQIFSVSEILAKISAELLQQTETFPEEERKITSLLQRNSFPVCDLDVKRASNGKFSVVIGLEQCKSFQNCPQEIAEIVSQVLGVQMLPEEEGCKNNSGCCCTLTVKEKEIMGITTGMARVRKDKARVSGDSFTFFRTREGKYIAAVSDGMGSGREANRLSETAIGLFEQLLDCGLSIRLALTLVNMMIEITSPEKYATMDISSTDLYTGETEFYKMGAMPSLVINGRNLDFIQNNNLPAGLQQENPITYEKRRISDGEFIIMMTDGAYDRLSNGNEQTLLEKVVSLKTTLNPQELAEHLLKSSCENKDEVSDDMTILVAKLWRKAA
ncbi:MAG: SpoIIE family protein phosphatase [Thermoclostridium sp.]|nr:SpoIIE family protein phosphatase [Thermoclostridium sp.]